MLDHRFDAFLQIKVTTGLVDAIDRAASRDLSTRSDFVRRVVMDRLRSDGIEIGQSSREVA